MQQKQFWSSRLAVALICGCVAGINRAEERSAHALDYLVIDVSAGSSAATYPLGYLAEAPPDGWADEYKTTKIVLRLIQAGTFMMGSPVGELGRKESGDEAQHEVSLTSAYYIGIFEVTQKQWERVMGAWPSCYNNPACRDSRPVENVSYFDIRGSVAGDGWPTNDSVDADSFMGRLRMRAVGAFDLPTESQWEYACRAGTATALNSGRNLTNTVSDAGVSEAGRYASNRKPGVFRTADTTEATSKAGSYLPNAWELYDMHGNVYEWCLDRSGIYPGKASDPRGAKRSPFRVLRGGSCNCPADSCRSASRCFGQPEGRFNNVGFRVALSPAKP